MKVRIAMTVKELNELLNERFSPALSCEWDNDGLQVTPDPGATVTGVLLALDLSDAAIACAKDSGCNVILNDALAERMGLSDVTPFADGIPRIGTFRAPMTPGEAVAFILGATGAPKALYSGKAPEKIARVAICSGDGKEYLVQAAEAGADLYFTGELSYHARLDAAAVRPGLRTMICKTPAYDGFSGGRLDI